MATQAASSRKNQTENDIGNGLDAASESAGSALDNMKEAGTNLIDDAKTALADKASTTVDEKKAMFAGGLTSVADSMRKLSGSLNEGEPTTLTDYSARYADAAAGKIENVARYFETADMSKISRDVESYARRNPAIFIGTAFGLGLLAARFLKSSGSTSSTSSRGGGGGQGKGGQMSTPMLPEKSSTGAGATA